MSSSSRQRTQTPAQVTSSSSDKTIFELDTPKAAAQVADYLTERLPIGLLFEGRLRTVLTQLAALPQDDSPIGLLNVDASLLTSFDATAPVEAWPPAFALLLWTPACLEYTAATLFTSLELPHADASEQHTAAVGAAITAIFRALKSHPLTVHLAKGLKGPSGFYISHCHGVNVPVLAATGALVELPSPPLFDQLIWRRSDIQIRPDDDAPLPPKLLFDAIHDDDAAEVMRLNPYVRSPEQVGTLTGLGIRSETDGALVAWGFYGLHGTLRTVHVQPEWRKQRLARRLVSRMLRPVGGAGTPGVLPTDARPAAEWMCASVAPDNVNSQRLMASFGAVKRWDVCWPQIELDRI